jgi:hypothetical protein
MSKILFTVGSLILLSASVGIASVPPVVSGGQTVPTCTYTALGDVVACD